MLVKWKKRQHSGRKLVITLLNQDSLKYGLTLYNNIIKI